MKNLKYILFSGLLLSSVACDKKLDIEPLQSVSENLALDTDANVKLVLQGAYDNISRDGVFGGNMFRDAELAGADGEVRWVGTFGDPRDIFNHTMDAGNFDADNTWGDAYATINSANNVLSAISVVNADDQDRVKGEALFLRAVCHYELVRIFGKPFEAGGANSQLGVPVILTPTRGVTDASYVSRNTVAEVYAAVREDLHEALNLLPEDNDVFANKYAAAALLARVHLTKGENAEALEHAEIVINSGVYSLVSDYEDLWNQDDNTEETIFGMQVSNQDGANELVTFFSIPEFGGRDGDIEIEQKHLDLYDPSDARLALFYDGNGATRTGKWRDQYKNIPVIRLAEMYLIAAECQARLSQNADDYYNAVHTRAGLAAKTNVTLNDILLERRLELAFEGHRIHDVKRLKGSVDGLNYDDDKLVFPIPSRETEANPNLQQNDGY
ncbi:MAG: RagB/SusD family nutrient uptake outer membrane protein [Saprospiraceae bacterium]|nr:RagB/SusD family nutrient uptake outer membrane protein [Saprospiraceae bacterium]